MQLVTCKECGTVYKTQITTTGPVGFCPRCGLHTNGYSRLINQTIISGKTVVNTSNDVKEKTCRNEWSEYGKFCCSNCGLKIDRYSTCTTTPLPIRYCLQCGAKVVE